MNKKVINKMKEVFLLLKKYYRDRLDLLTNYDRFIRVFKVWLHYSLYLFIIFVMILNPVLVIYSIITKFFSFIFTGILWFTFISVYFSKDNLGNILQKDITGGWKGLFQLLGYIFRSFCKGIIVICLLSFLVIVLYYVMLKFFILELHFIEFLILNLYDIKENVDFKYLFLLLGGVFFGILYLLKIVFENFGVGEISSSETNINRQTFLTLGRYFWNHLQHFVFDYCNSFFIFINIGIQHLYDKELPKIITVRNNLEKDFSLFNYFSDYCDSFVSYLLFYLEPVLVYLNTIGIVESIFTYYTILVLYLLNCMLWVIVMFSNYFYIFNEGTYLFFDFLIRFITLLLKCLTPIGSAFSIIKYEMYKIKFYMAWGKGNILFLLAMELWRFFRKYYFLRLWLSYLAREIEHSWYFF